MATAHGQVRSRVATAGTWLDAQIASERTRSIGRRRLVRISGILGIALFLTTTIGYKPIFRNNFDEVVPDRLYRSAQPDDRFGKWIEAHNLRSVLNLRGGKPAYDWYAQEIRIVRDHGVDYYEIPMSAQIRPKRRDLLQIIDLLGRARYPMLIHCKSGADRTGLGVALYHMIVQKEPPQTALDGFSLFYGHIPLLGPEKLQHPIREYAYWLEAKDLIHTPERFREWVEKEYDENG
jgi:protein tyrosine/serine phosphatase